MDNIWRQKGIICRIGTVAMQSFKHEYPKWRGNQRQSKRGPKSQRSRSQALSLDFWAEEELKMLLSWVSWSTWIKTKTMTMTKARLQLRENEWWVKCSKSWSGEWTGKPGEIERQWQRLDFNSGMMTDNQKGEKAKCSKSWSGKWAGQPGERAKGETFPWRRGQSWTLPQG